MRVSSAWRLAGREPWLVVLALACVVVWSTYSILNYLHYGNYTDLAIFDQGIWHYSRFEAPISTILSRVGYPNFLGDHFHPILLVLTPLYWLWADPRMLFIAQAVLIAASIFPVFSYCARRLGRRCAYMLAGAYASFWGIHSAIAFDFHEVAFAPLLIALMIDAADLGRWRRFFGALAALLLVKESLGIFAAFFGLYLLVTRRWRQGAITLAIGVVWFLLTTKLFIPLLADGRPYRHWNYRQFGDDLPEALANIASYPGLFFDVLLGSPEKLRALWYFFVPFLCLTVASPLVILTVPLLLEKMLSTNPFMWGTELHYSLTIAPVIVMGAAAGLHNLLRLPGVERLRAVGLRPPTLAAAATAVILFANAWIATGFPLWSLTDPDFYRRSPADRVVQRALAKVPPQASVAAQIDVLPHLTRRKEAYWLRPGVPATEYIVAEPGDYFTLAYPRARFVDRQRLVLEKSDRYTPIFSEGGWVVLRRKPREQLLAEARARGLSSEG
ncbi:MAG: DUF2079 domain-containing protein [Actinomycetota bacterium]|nr:DUF2079 domain-containing protein [Actinomycetota bacterium]